MKNSILNDLQNQSLISFLDMSRWAAAAIVFISHLRNPLFFSYGSINPEEVNVVIQIWYFISGWAGESVIIFFVLSGLLVGASGYEKIKIGKFSTSSYLIDRFSRLYIVIIPALILSYIFDYIGLTFFSDAGFWDHSHPMINEKIDSAPFETKLSFENFAANFFMLQHFFFDTLGSNSPLWTISAEFWFYIVFAIFALLNLDHKNHVKALLVLVILVFLYLFGFGFLHLLGYWLVGVFAGIIKSSNIVKPFYAFLLVLFSLVFSRIFINPSSSSFEIALINYIVAISYGLLILSIRGRNIYFFTRVASLNKFLASFSFSLYLLHFPMMLFLLAILNNFQYFSEISLGYSPTNLAGIVIYFLLIVFIFFFSYLFSLFTEKKTYLVRNWMKKNLLTGDQTR
jgi:peptidoglycan/LPS O-acetylase OafA/YrhL